MTDALIQDHLRATGSGGDKAICTGPILHPVLINEVWGLMPLSVVITAIRVPLCSRVEPDAGSSRCSCNEQQWLPRRHHLLFDVR